MGWPVPQRIEAPAVQKPSAWFVGLVCGGLLVVTAALVVFVWPSIHGQATGWQFWLCLLGLPTLVCAVFLGLFLHFHEMAVFRSACIALYSLLVMLVWQRWSRRYVVVVAAATLTSEDSLAEKIAGLAGSAPQNKMVVTKLEEFEGELDGNRVELVLARLLENLSSAINALGADCSLNVQVWTGGTQDPAAFDASMRTLWEKLALLPHPKFAATETLSWSMVEQHALNQAAPLLVLCVQLHDADEALAQFSESAAGLLFDAASTPQRGGRPAVRLFRSQPVSIGSMRADLVQLGEVGAVALKQVRIAWNCGLGKAEGYELSQAIADSGLVLKGGATGMVSLSDCIGPTGPISPWVSLGLATELSRYGQEAQLLAVQEANQVTLAVIATAARESVPDKASMPSVDLRGAALLVCSVPWLSGLLAALLKSADLFPWMIASLVVAGLFALLTMLVHPLTVRISAEREVMDVGARLPAGQ
ncbi:hypothetical protein [Ralstonia sp. 1138]|uniref:hypothetical protein n=1 Tax=Ralstonia sp. 1138 TaxID=3156423 RepID=UPI00339B796D